MQGARGIAALEDAKYPLPGVLDPVLNLQQFNLQFLFANFVIRPRHSLFVWVVLG